MGRITCYRIANIAGNEIIVQKIERLPYFLIEKNLNNRSLYRKCVG